jgi:hypothetical protein
MHVMFADALVKALHADCDPLVPVQDKRKLLSCAMLHAEAFAGAA